MVLGYTILQLFCSVISHDECLYYYYYYYYYYYSH